MSNDKDNEFVTPVGRIVAEDLWEPQTTDFQGNPLTVKTGANAGQARVQYFLALAIPKNHPEWPALYAKFVRAANQGFPTLIGADGAQHCRDFAWKIVDGDSTIVNKAGSRPCDKEGYPGNWVINLSTSHAIKVYDRENRMIAPETKAVKCGDFVRVAGTVAANGNATNPGIYINPRAVQFSHQGEEIVKSLNPEVIFGATPMPAAPVSAITTPGPALAPMPMGNPTAATATAPSPVSAPAPVAPISAPANVAPAHDFLNPPAPTAPAAPAPVVEHFLINGSVYTRDALRANGWTDVQIDTQQRT